MSRTINRISRRNLMRNAGLAGVASAGAGGASEATARTAATPGDARAQLRKRVDATLFVDTHEHLFEEEERLARLKPRDQAPADDWTVLLLNYINSDLQVAGMSEGDLKKVLSSSLDPMKKWELVEPHWPAVRLTGYGQAVEIAARKLYGVEGLSRKAIPRMQEGFSGWVKPGFYRKMLHDVAGIESCQVNQSGPPFLESRQPDLLIQDIGFVGMHMLSNIEGCTGRPGIKVRDLADWHAVIDWWFKTYAPFSAAVKSQAAYNRSLDYEDVPAEKAAPLFLRKLSGQKMSPEESKPLEDHLFWYCVRKATEWKLPVKIHTGYCAGANKMPISRVQGNPASAADLCRKAPDTTFVFMHISYPYYEALISVAKQYSNAFIDMCWAWIISPVASVDFLKHYLVTAPANKVFAFGGDYRTIEPVVGHAEIARRGIVRALSELVEEGWLNLDSALEQVEPLMAGNPRRVFRLSEKAADFKRAPWLPTGGTRS